MTVARAPAADIDLRQSTIGSVGWQAISAEIVVHLIGVK
jgi:hypothetical protein